MVWGRSSCFFPLKKTHYIPCFFWVHLGFFSYPSSLPLPPAPSLKTARTHPVSLNSLKNIQCIWPVVHLFITVSQPLKETILRKLIKMKVAFLRWLWQWASSLETEVFYTPAISECSKSNISAWQIPTQLHACSWTHIAFGKFLKLLGLLCVPVFCFVKKQLFYAKSTHLSWQIFHSLFKTCMSWASTFLFSFFKICIFRN